MTATSQRRAVAPGARIVVRDAEWVVRRVDQSSDGGQQLTCDGVSAIVRGQEGVFLSNLDRDIEILDPAKTKLVRDESPAFVRARLFIESQLRQATPSDGRVRVGHLAAMNEVPYQLDPAAQALEQARQRILIADAVGLGKTLEAGVLVSELIARGRGRRILVLAVKSMLTQFQKEFWNRFTIPLTRLDSDGLRRVRSRIPTNHNPFYYYDKTIISIDTLKQDGEYRSYLESAYWDIIVIDEAHNVADRGTGSLRSRLAKLLSKCSDTLIMLSATPHDGKARSFASLMNMLDPTAIVDPDDYAKEDFRSKGLVIRRFKKDIQHQVREAFRDREVHAVRVRSSADEEAAYEALLAVRTASRSGTGKRDLFAVGLEKALFSSPAACRETALHRIKSREREVQKRRGPEPAGLFDAVAPLEREVRTLRDLVAALDRIGREEDSRYQQLVRSIRGGAPFRWKGRDSDDRLVIFTERIATMNWLAEGLTKDLKLKANQVETLHGSMSDIDQTQVVEDFGNRLKPVRLLVCSDVASEGINLHYRCHRLIHYDMPWSLMVFQQRNGRIDRYGQTEKPEIVYLQAESGNETIRGDQRILEVLKDKDGQAYKNIGDPSVFMNMHSIEAEEEITEDAIAEGKKASDFDRQLQPKADEGDELMEMFVTGGASPGSDGAPVPAPATASVQPKAGLSVFHGDLAYCEAALHHLRGDDPGLSFEVERESGSLALDAPGDLRFRFDQFPREVRPENWRFELTTDRKQMGIAIEDSRKNEQSWPRKHYLWRLNPVVAWIDDRMLAAFGRHEAPVMAGVPGLMPDEAAFGFSGLVPNRKSHPLVYEWGAVILKNGQFSECIPFASLLERTGLHRGQIPNRNAEVDFEALASMLPAAVLKASEWVDESRKAFDEANDPKLQKALDELEDLKVRQIAHAKRKAAESKYSDAMRRGILDRKRKDIDEIFASYLDWVQDSMILEGQAWIRLLCVMTGRT